NLLINSSGIFSSKSSATLSLPNKKEAELTINRDPKPSGIFTVWVSLLFDDNRSLYHFSNAFFSNRSSKVESLIWHPKKSSSEKYFSNFSSEYSDNSDLS